MATWIVVGGIIALLVVIRLSQAGIPIVRTSWSSTKKLATLLASAQGKPAAGTTSATKTDPSDLGKGVWKAVKWVLLLVIISWSSWSWYSIENEVGFPGTYVANKSYKRSVTINITEEAFQPEGQRFCEEIRAGKWKFTFPNEARLEKDHPREAGFWMRDSDGEIGPPMSFFGRVRINKVTADEERVLIGEDGCFRVFIKASPRAVMLGNRTFIGGNPVLYGPESPSRPAIVTVKFYG